VREKRVLLEDEAYGTPLRRSIDSVLRVEPDLAVRGDYSRVRSHESRDRAQKGRLARPRGADERHRLLADLEL
jgi:hypothetical protein